MELEMATLYLTERQTLVKKDGDTLLVAIPADPESGRAKRDVRVPLMKIERVVVQGNVTLTSPALAALMEQRAEVSFLNEHGRFQGQLTPAFSRNGQLRLAQTAAHVDAARAHGLARAFVVGKMTNMRTMLLRANRKRERPELAQAAEAIRRAMTEAAAIPPDATPPDPARPQADSAYGRLQGQEGAATAHYFGCFRHILNRPELFNGRSRRPPRDPANALLSYGYTILLNQVTSAICAVGLDPYVGYLHSTQYGKPALALDLMEEFRPLADRLALSLVNRLQIGEADFALREGGAVMLEGDARKQVVIAFQERKQEALTHPLLAESLPLGLVPLVQARLLARHLRGEADHYAPFRMR